MGAILRVVVVRPTRPRTMPLATMFNKNEVHWVSFLYARFPLVFPISMLKGLCTLLAFHATRAPLLDRGLAFGEIKAQNTVESRFS